MGLIGSLWLYLGLGEMAAAEMCQGSDLQESTRSLVLAGDAGAG